MASQAHVGGLNQVDQASTSSSGEEENDDETSTSSDEPDEVKAPSKPKVTAPSLSRHPKMRIKLRLSNKIAPVATAAASTATKKDLIASRNIKLPSAGKRQRPSATQDVGSDNNADEVKATVVDSDEAGEDDAVATAVVDEPGTAGSSSAAPGTPTTTRTSGPTKRRTTAGTSRPIRLPPIGSPGLLMAPPPSSAVGGGSGSSGSKKDFVTAASVFDHNMAMAGYTAEARTARPHRGSSIRRVVGDMFDSNVKLSLHFPELVPGELMAKTPNAEKTESKENGHTEKQYLPKVLIESLESATRRPREENSDSLMNVPVDGSSRKRRRPWRFSDMVPVSLTVPYPESYIQKRLKYVQDVEARELAIIKFQEAEEETDLVKEQADAKGEENRASHPSANVPPIPDPPTPPKIHEMTGFPSSKYDDRHPLYPPRAKESFVAHLDKNCFHIVDGRYFGLMTNFIADPNFVGPNAPGIAGVNASGGSGLATSTSGSGSSAGMALTLSASFHSSIVGSSSTPRPTNSTNKPAPKKSPPPSAAAVGKPEPAKTASTVKKNSGPKPTSTAGGLRKVMEEGGALSETMKTCIVRAAVHGSRSGRHGQSFLAPNGEMYPDVSKAFAAHAGIKPCQRCKNNKQGAYHCRLRRKHKDLDYDGGNSSAILAPLFTVPMDSLLCPKSS